MYKNQRNQLPNKSKAPHRALIKSTILYGNERWPLTAERLLFISYTKYKTNECVRQQVGSPVGNQEPLLSTAKRCKISWFGHVNRHNTVLNTILGGKRRQAGRTKTWLDNIDEWTELSLPTLYPQQKIGQTCEDPPWKYHPFDRPDQVM